MPSYFDEKRQRYRVNIDRRRPDGRRSRITKMLPRGTTKDEAEAIAAKIEADEFLRQSLRTTIETWPAYVESLMGNSKSWIHKAVSQTKSRAKKWGGTSGLTAYEVKSMLLRSGGRCEVTGLLFSTDTSIKRNPLSPSIDRIDSSLGYTQSNCRVVCYAVNIAMLHWGEDVFAQIATGWVINKYTVMSLVKTMRF